MGDDNPLPHWHIGPVTRETCRVCVPEGARDAVNLQDVHANISPTVAVLHCSIAALEGPEYLSKERRAQIAEQLRAIAIFIEQLGGHLA